MSGLGFLLAADLHRFCEALPAERGVLHEAVPKGNGCAFGGPFAPCAGCVGVPLGQSNEHEQSLSKEGRDTRAGDNRSDSVVS